MIPFLKYVADDLLRKNGPDLGHTVVVFPNKRAGLFFNEYLMSAPVRLPGSSVSASTSPVSVPLKDGPLWSPRYQSIIELFRSLSDLQPADPIECVCRIHRHYTALTGNRESLDFFYGWGERLLGDFDDADKNMVDTDRLLRNLKEIKALDRNDFLDAAQERALQDFFRDFSIEGNTRLRQKFLELWNCLHELYERLNAELEAEGEAYEGALCRRVVERLESGLTALPPDIKCFVFVGFNVLSKVEERLFSFLQKRGKALFYWDYDTFYTDTDHISEAGVFLQGNLQKFPNQLPETCFDNFRRDKHIEFVSAPTESAQARAVTPWLREHLTADEKQTAIVLCNENLLLPVLHALPPEVHDVNVTKGFPLHHTPAYAFVEEFFAGLSTNGKAEAEEQNGGSTTINAPTPAEFLEELITKVSEEARKADGKPDAAEAGNDNGLNRTLRTEAFFKVHTILQRFRRLLEKGSLPVTLPTLHRLLRQVLRQTSIPFNGEPAVGLQIMGVLETRNLDFENVLMLSVNEGKLPRQSSDNSFIPYNLRREYGLTTSRHNTAVYAYHFYRLLQRTRHVRLIYNCSSDGMVKGEMSRFMTQLLVETRLPVRHFALTSKQALPTNRPPIIPKPENLPATLATLSPSALNTYLRCQLMFYFQRVARLKEPAPPADVIEPNTFGTIFHHAAELIYREKLTERGALITAETLERFLKEGGDERLAGYIRRSFEDNGIDYHIIVAEVVKSYLRQLIRHDLRLTPFVVKGTELNTETPLEIPYGAGTVTVRLKGNIDRLDLVEAGGITTLRVVDYKTGGQPESARDLEQLFTPAEKHPHYVLQTFLYSLTLLDKTSYPIAPALFFVHKAAGEDYVPYIDLGEGKAKAPVMDFRRIAPEFRERLIALIAEILDPERPFAPTPFERFCENCPFTALCHK